MTDPARTTVIAALALVLAGTVVGACKKNEASIEPSDGAAPAAESVAVDALGDHERALADNAEKLRGLGVALDAGDRTAREPERDGEDDTMDEHGRDSESSKPKPNVEAPPKVVAATRCDELCGLAGTACELRGQICELAEDHVGEPRYEDACWRATDQCNRASAACDDCRGTKAAG